MSKWPQLVLPQFCTTALQVHIESEETGEDGAPASIVNWSGTCNYQDKAKKVYTSEKVLVEVTGTCLIPGDIAPDLDVISAGKVTIMGTNRDIAIGTKARNPDGSVNYTQLELK